MGTAAALFRERISGSLGRGNIKSMMETSEKLWLKTVDQRHEYRQRFPNMDFFPARDVHTYFTYLASIWDLIPASYNCPWEVERIGRMGDGGKWVCGMSRYEKNKKPCIIYSFGVQNESTWAAIGSETDTTKSPPSYTIQDLMAKNGHDYIDILKVDIEYAEFNALSALNSYTQKQQIQMPIGQVLIEIHLMVGQGLTAPVFLDWWESLEYRGFRSAWTEPNLLVVTLGLEGRMPAYAEYTWVNVQDPKNILWK
ncbi:hypothetical protein M7I_6341 [Glarea lozoyensis 74030]|uniref:Methyltransferase FkbM domain-containing protein n=1 Tax=Glarea lozoyensis (strain ATCC 74030 / MF5533) TaxID=1104152 RepID=H0EUA8_GLAL7|nr:hypothetical protein M7I_6341 [Glarea lozoyensis 74030]